VADVYDALTSKRVYKNAYTHDQARSIILEGAGAHFDPDIVAAFTNVESQFLGISQRFADTCAKAA
jgi:putative two-component system response regulator